MTLAIAILATFLVLVVMLPLAVVRLVQGPVSRAAEREQSDVVTKVLIRVKHDGTFGGLDV